MATFEIKRNDTKPALTVTLQDSTGSAIDLTNATKINFNMATNDNAYTFILSGPCTVTGSTTGQVEYRWQSGTAVGVDTARSGLFLGEIETTFNGSAYLTLPSDNSLIIKINEDYDGD